MPCETSFKKNQTLAQRKEEVRKAVEQLAKDLASGRRTAKVGPQGAIAFSGVELQNAGVTDNCAYRRIMATGSAAAKLAIQRAEILAGRTVNKAVINSGAHSHDGGHTWHNHKG